MTDTIADVLDRAADVIAERGHCKGAYERPDGSVCAIGAIRIAVTGQTLPRRPSAQKRRQAIAACISLAGDLAAPVSHWNDAPERTADEVIAALREAASRERNVS